MSESMRVRDRVVELRRVPARDLLPDERNWRRHPPAQQRALRSMLEDVGYAGALLVRETPEGLRLIDGHLRAETTPDDLVPVLVLDVDEEEAGKLLATLDPLAGMAVADHDTLAALLDAVAIPDEDLLAHVQEMGGISVEKSRLTDPDALPPIPAEPKTRPGDLWMLGDHRLLCADSRSPEAIERLMNGALIDLLVTSPPYNVGLDYEAYDDAEKDRESYLGFLGEVLAAWVPKLGDGRFIAWNVGVHPKTHHLHQGILLERAGLVLRRQLTWVKSGVPLPTFQHTRKARLARRYSPNYRHEVVYLASNAEPEQGGPIELPGVGESDVWEFIHQSGATRDIPAGRSERRERRRNSGLARHAVKAHPAAFPVKLPETLGAYLTAVGETMADPFVGTGSTLMAAEISKRRGFGCELDPRYVDVAVSRWEAFTGESAVLVRG